MSPRRFWRSTPAQINTLSKVHGDINKQDKDKEFIARTVEEVPFMI